MIYLTTYEAVRRMNGQRVARALARSCDPIDSFVRPQPAVGADVIEVMFGARCDESAIGA